MPICNKCLIDRPRDDFRYRKKRNGIDYYNQSMCKICERTRAKELWYKKHDENKEKLKFKIKYLMYGITEEDFNVMLKNQSNMCAICKSLTPGGKGNWHIDHCHTTGKVRGLLCHKCNTGLGLFNDDPNILIKAKEYLLEHK